MISGIRAGKTLREDNYRGESTRESIAIWEKNVHGRVEGVERAVNDRGARRGRSTLQAYPTNDSRETLSSAIQKSSEVSIWGSTVQAETVALKYLPAPRVYPTERRVSPGSPERRKIVSFGDEQCIGIE